MSPRLTALHFLLPGTLGTKKEKIVLFFFFGHFRNKNK